MHRYPLQNNENLFVGTMVSQYLNLPFVESSLPSPACSKTILTGIAMIELQQTDQQETAPQTQGQK